MALLAHLKTATHIPPTPPHRTQGKSVESVLLTFPEVPPPRVPPPRTESIATAKAGTCPPLPRRKRKFLVPRGTPSSPLPPYSLASETFAQATRGAGTYRLGETKGGDKQKAGRGRGSSKKCREAGAQPGNSLMTRALSRRQEFLKQEPGKGASR